jgi:MFS family permease
MAKRASTKHPSNRRSSTQRRSQKPAWQQWLLALTLVPLGVGLVLLVGAVANVIVWGSRRDQIVMAGFYILFSFVASNAVQKQWMLTAGWTLLGVAAWLLLNSSAAGIRVVAAALAGIAVGLISREFLWRARQRSEKDRKRK